MSLRGLPFPRTPSGRASLLPDAPWHYSGDLLTVEFRADPAAVADLLPSGVEPARDDEDPGALAFIWADWQSCGADGAELLDPVRAQYREAFVVARCRYGGQLYSRCLFIWVDTDFALVRGHLQGYPKKLGSIHQTRPVSVGRAGPRLEAGGRFGMTLAAGDRRLAEATVTLTGPSETNGFVNGHPMLHHRWTPRIELDGTDSLAEVVTMSGVDVELGPAYRGDATLALFDSPTEELAALAPREILGGYFRTVGTTFAGGTTLEPGA
ncbi:MAG TPA: acetoacetate decarboxylase family protein [Acidimicrobiales bacterium]|nr:acetoacetate decarboxylase family protein [Acidimicrobiales bacterium]